MASRCLSGEMSHSIMVCDTCDNACECKHPYMKERPICLYGANPYSWTSRCSAILDDDDGVQVFCYKKRGERHER